MSKWTAQDDDLASTVAADGGLSILTLGCLSRPLPFLEERCYKSYYNLADSCSILRFGSILTSSQANAGMVNF